jgi:type I restriction enzyme S subunit
MKLNYKKLGDYIQLVDERNKNLEVSNLLGVSIQKKFIPSIANVSETDMSVYRIVKKDQFAFSPVTSRNGNKFTIALLKEVELAIISPAYQVFEVIDDNLLLPEYLFIFVNRVEFDRYTRFNSWGSARETFSWDDICNIEMPIPDIEVQKNVVAVYNELLRNQKSYEGSLKDLQLICDSFLNSLKENKVILKELRPYIKQRTDRSKNDRGFPVQGVSNSRIFIETKANTTGFDFDNYKIVKENDFAYNPSRLNIGSIALRKKGTCIVSPIYVVFEIVNQKELLPEYLFLWFSRKSFCDYVYFYSFGSVRDTFEYSLMEEVVLPIPDIEIQKSIVAIHHVLESRKKLNEDLKNMISPLCPVLMKGVVDTLTTK